jgi:hypothetical protein
VNLLGIANEAAKSYRPEVQAKIIDQQQRFGRE